MTHDKNTVALINSYGIKSHITPDSFIVYILHLHSTLQAFQPMYC